MNKKIIWGLGAGCAVVALALLLRPSDPRPAVAQGAPPASRQAALAVTATIATEQAWPQVVEASGALAPWQEAVISAEVGSLKITDLLADIGSVVRKGQELARLSQDSIRATLRKQEAELALANASLTKAKADAERARRVKDSGALSEQQVADYLTAEATAKATTAAAEANLEATRITLEQTIVRAMDDGVITSRTATLGSVVGPGTELFRMLRQSKIEWHAELDARLLAAVRPGQKARVTLADGRQVEGKVRITSPSLNGDSLRGIVYVSLPADSGITAGDYASGTIELGTANALTVPVSALVMRDGRSYVVVLGADNRASFRVVTTTRRQDNRVEISQGLKVNERLVESGGAFLSDGSLVHVVAPGQPGSNQQGQSK